MEDNIDTPYGNAGSKVSTYRPICDTWILARAKLKGGEKYYGAYPGGFVERARVFLPVTIDDPVLHVCAGMVRLYPYGRAFGPNDCTMDFDPALKPDFLHDVRSPIPEAMRYPPGSNEGRYWRAILTDPPYSEKDAESYAPGDELYPKPNLLLRNCIDAVRVGGRVGLLHYEWAKPPVNAKNIATVKVLCGFNNRVRLYSVYERIE